MATVSGRFGSEAAVDKRTRLETMNASSSALEDSAPRDAGLQLLLIVSSAYAAEHGRALN
jgi:hypothetical protein